MSGQKTREKGEKAADKKACFTRQARAEAERNARVYHEPDPNYDPALGYNPQTGPRPGSPPVDAATGLAQPMNCIANPKANVGEGTLPKFYCSVEGIVDEKGDLVRFKIRPHFKGPERDKRNGEAYGEFLSSRFSQALGFYAHDSWVADVNCPDCERSLTKDFQGAKFTPFQPAAGVEVSLGDPIDVNCEGNESADLARSLNELGRDPSHRAEVDAFKLWLAFIDHGDTKSANQRFACLSSKKNADGTRTCEPGQSIFFVSDMGSTFGHSSASEKKAKLAIWKGKDPIKVSGGRCYSTAKSIGNAQVGEPGRQLLAQGLQRLLDAEARDGVITRVFKASRNAERDQPAEAWTAEFVRKAKTIINARCSK
jgi:hypothetical protein